MFLLVLFFAPKKRTDLADDVCQRKTIFLNFAVTKYKTLAI
jgi:hypothetical protein